jgi:hypothetical protein
LRQPHYEQAIRDLFAQKASLFASHIIDNVEAMTIWSDTPTEEIVATLPDMISWPREEAQQ